MGASGIERLEGERLVLSCSAATDVPLRFVLAESSGRGMAGFAVHLEWVTKPPPNPPLFEAQTRI